MSLITKVLRAGETRMLRDLEALVVRVNQLESSISSLTDGELRAKTDEFRSRLADGESVDDLEAEAYAVVREAAQRVLGQRHFDVQIVGAGTL
ncbi:MAG: preprotein translocase subunit SecA, partial [Acidimicrobiia bacterium]